MLTDWERAQVTPEHVWTWLGAGCMHDEIACYMGCEASVVLGLESAALYQMQHGGFPVEKVGIPVEHREGTR